MKVGRGGANSQDSSTHFYTKWSSTNPSFANCCQNSWRYTGS